MKDFGEPMPGAELQEAAKSEVLDQENTEQIVDKESGDEGRNDSTSSFFFDIQENEGKYKVTSPGGYTDIGAIASYSRTVDSREEAERILQEAKGNFNPRVEAMSLQKSFTTFHSIKATEDGKYFVTFPGLRSLDNPNLLVGTSSKTFDNWEEARDFYLESRNKREYPEEAVFELRMDDVDYRFLHLNNFGKETKLSEKPMEISKEARAVLDFDSRNIPDPDSAHTYYKTVEIPDWQGQIFSFIGSYSKTPEGQRLVEQLDIKDLTLLRPQQAAQLTLELVTRLKKYNLDEMGGEHGETQSDQHSALYLLHRGLREKDSDDFKGNGICRNFASTVKVVFEAIKAKQTKFNYLQDTYAFYESGSRADFDPSYEAQSQNLSLTLKTKKESGHAWNSFVTVGENDISQTVVDATWSNFDYDTLQSVKLDYTLQRMERDIYRNFKRKDVKLDAEQATQFYLFLLDSLPQQEGLVLDEEAVARIKSSNLYKGIEQDIKYKYQELSPEQFEDFTFKIYKKLVDARNLKNKTQFYLERAMELVKGRELNLSEDSAAELTRLVAEIKQDVGYFDIITVYALPTQRTEDRQAVVAKYVKAWEETNKKGYTPPANLVFRNQEIQVVVLEFCSPTTRELVQKELNG
jgi:hypothetical protein